MRITIWIDTLINAFTSSLDSTGGLIAIILSGLSGGFFAGFFANSFESNRRISNKRLDKYLEHRNTLVQIEQELIPLRVNMSRNIHSIRDARENINDLNVRFILRFYKLSLSTGLGLKILNTTIINKYSQLYSAVETLNSDIKYLTGMVEAIRESAKQKDFDDSLIESYIQMVSYLHEAFEETDLKSLELLSFIKVALTKADEKVRSKFINDGKEVKYSISNKTLSIRSKEIEKEEDPSSHEGEKQPKFFAPFLDLKRIIIHTTSPLNHS